LLSMWRHSSSEHSVVPVFGLHRQSTHSTLYFSPKGQFSVVNNVKLYINQGLLLTTVQFLTLPQIRLSVNSEYSEKSFELPNFDDVSDDSLDSFRTRNNTTTTFKIHLLLLSLPVIFKLKRRKTIKEPSSCDSNRLLNEWQSSWKKNGECHRNIINKMWRGL